MDVTLGSGDPWGGSSGFPSQPGLFNEGPFAAGSNGGLNLPPQGGALPMAAAAPGGGAFPAGTSFWSGPSVPAERGEFAQGFLWFDAPAPGYGVGGLKAEDVGSSMLPPYGAAQPLPATSAPPFQPASSLMYPTQHIVVEQLQPGQTLVPVTQLHSGGQHAAAAAAATAAAEAPQAAAPPPASQAAARGRKGGRARSFSNEEERKARNRATQARFRERQKAKNDALLAQHAAAEDELERERGAQAALQAQQAVLQKMLVVRDGALAALGAAPPPAGPDGGGAAGAAAAAAQPAALPAGAAPLPALEPPAAGSTGSTGAFSQDGGAADVTSPEGRTASGGGLSSAIQQSMEWLGRELTAQMAMLELPATADPDELMAVAHAQLAPLAAGPGGAHHALPPAPPPPLDFPDQDFPDQPAAASAAAAAADAAATSSGSLSAQASAGSGGAATSSTGAASSAGRGAPQPIGLAALFREKPDLAARCRAMSGEEFVADWVDKARAFRELLAAYDAEGGDETLERILDIFRAWGGTLSLTLHLKPENAQVLFATAANAPPGTWEATAASLKPTRAQRVMLRQLWHAYAGRTQAIRAERAAAMAAVHQAAAAANVTPDTLPASTLGNLMSRYLSLFDAAGRVASLRDAEFIAMLQLMGRVGAVFSPVQKARSVAACYPHFPDVVQIVRHLATDQGQPAAQPQPEQLS